MYYLLGKAGWEMFCSGRGHANRRPDTSMLGLGGIEHHRQGRKNVMAEKSVNCVSCSEPNTATVTTHCVECGAGLCSAHIFECRGCNMPMCIACWRKLGKDLCMVCLSRVESLPDDEGIPVDSYWDRTDLIQRGGQTPQCCGEPMTAEDDHGRFVCFSCGKRVSL